MIRTEQLQDCHANFCIFCGGSRVYPDFLEDEPTADFPIPHITHGYRCGDCGFFLTDNESGLAFAKLNK